MSRLESQDPILFVLNFLLQLEHTQLDYVMHHIHCCSLVVGFNTVPNLEYYCMSVGINVCTLLPCSICITHISQMAIVNAMKFAI